jgi:hypothetical protein
MYTAGMLDESGKSVLERAIMTEDQARRLKERGADGSGTVSGRGVKRLELAMFDQGETRQGHYRSLAQRISDLCEVLKDLGGSGSTPGRVPSRAQRGIRCSHDPSGA